MWLASVMVAAELAQGAPPRPPPEPPPKPVDEVVVTAPRRSEPPPPEYGVLTGPGGRQFQAEAARKDQMRRYRDTGSMKDYPGLRCAVFHRC